MKTKCSKFTKKKTERLLLSSLLTLLVLSGCIAKNDISISVKKPAKKETTPTAKPVTVSNIQVVNNQIVITGTNLDTVQNFKIKEGSTNTNLQIESQSATTIVANSLSNVTFAAGKILDFIFSNAEAASTFTVNFSLCDSSLGGKAFNCLITPNDKEVLSYDAASGKWQPRAVNGLSYIGTFDASGGSNPAAKPAGQYYIVSVAGDIDAGATILGVGDWIVSNGSSWQKIDNSTVITSVHGRTGAVVGAEGDYTLTELDDVTLTAPANNQILKFNGTAWVNSDLSALGGGTVTSVSGTPPISVSNGTSTPAISISQANTTTNGYLSSADWNTFNNKQPTIAVGTTAQYYRGDKSWQTLDTLAVPENTNLYFTNARALGVPLTGFATDTNAIVATDTILQAFGKTQGQINNLTSGGSNFLVKNAADTVTGQVTLHAATGALKIPTTPSGVDLTDAANVQYVNTYADNKVAKAGGTMTGDLQVNTKIKLQDTGTNTVSIQAPTTITASYTLKLPPAVGTLNQVLTTDASGNLSWTTPAGGGAPSGAAGGELAGTYPNPTIAANAITDTHIAANAISQSKINGLTTALTGKEPTITAGTTAQYLRGDKSLSTFADDVWATVLTGLSTATNSAITATDSVLVSFGKLQAQISGQATTLSGKADQTNGTQTITAAVVTGLTAPVAGSDAANKDYVDGFAVWSKGAGANAGDVYRATGKVGIGTATPSAQLETTGDIKIHGLSIGRGGGAISGNIALGENALQGTNTGYSNIAIGEMALNALNSGYENLAIGAYVMAYDDNNGSYRNTGIGNLALQGNYGGYSNTAVGYSSMNSNDTGYDNTAIGEQSMSANRTGFENSAMGKYSMLSARSGSKNTVIGSYAGQGTNNASNYMNNTLLGHKAGHALLTAGSNNILLGYQAGDQISSGSNNIVIGYDIDLPLSSTSNSLNIGNLIYGTGLTSTGTTVSTGFIGIGTAAPGSALDVKGTLRLSGSASGYVGFAPAAAAGTTTYTLPITQGTAGQVLSTDGVAGTPTLSWISPPSAPVATVHGRTGAVVGANGDYTASQVTNVAAGNIAATTTQAAIDELDSEKQSIATFAADVRAVVLTGLSTATNAVIAATDSVLVAFGKLQAQIDGLNTTAANYLVKNGTDTITGQVTVHVTTGALKLPRTPSAAELTDAANVDFVKTYVDGFGQWTKGAGANAGDVYRGTGNVGIGTAAPTTKLDIDSTGTLGLKVRSTTAASAAYLFLQNDLGNSAQLAFGGSTSSIAGKFTISADAGVTPHLSVISTGSVGIGTTTPVMLLDVNGGARVLASVEGAEAEVSPGASITIPNLSKNIRRIVLTANTTITLPSIVADTNLPTDAAYSLTMKIKQGGTGSYTITWGGNGKTIKWDMGSAPAPATAVGTETIYQCMIIGGETVWYCSMVWQEQ